MIEKELKSIITEDEFEILKKMFVWDKIITQTNHYYSDKNGNFKKNGITMRIRTIDNQNKLQVKNHLGKSVALQVSDETEFIVTSVPEFLTADEVFEYAGICEEAFLLGSLTTTRHSFMYTDNVEICLDKSSYLGIFDYETEIEFNGDIPQELLQQFSAVGINFDKKSVGKYSRFINRLSGIANNKS